MDKKQLQNTLSLQEISTDKYHAMEDKLSKQDVLLEQYQIELHSLSQQLIKKHNMWHLHKQSFWLLFSVES